MAPDTFRGGSQLHQRPHETMIALEQAVFIVGLAVWTLIFRGRPRH